MIQLQKPGAELGHVDLDRALRGAGFTRQAASHCLIDFVGKVLLPDLLPNRINSSFCDAGDIIGESDVITRRHHINALLALQPQPLANQRGTSVR